MFGGIKINPWILTWYSQEGVTVPLLCQYHPQVHQCAEKQIPTTTLFNNWSWTKTVPTSVWLGRAGGIWFLSDLILRLSCLLTPSISLPYFFQYFGRGEHSKQHIWSRTLSPLSICFPACPATVGAVGSSRRTGYLWLREQESEPCR